MTCHEEMQKNLSTNNNKKHGMFPSLSSLATQETHVRQRLCPGIKNQLGQYGRTDLKRKEKLGVTAHPYSPDTQKAEELKLTV